MKMYLLLATFTCVRFIDHILREKSNQFYPQMIYFTSTYSAIHPGMFIEG